METAEQQNLFAKKSSKSFRMLIYVDEISERLIYTLDFVFKERGLSYSLTNDGQHFITSSTAKINYSERYFSNELQLKSSTVLFDEEVFVYEIGSGTFEDEECLSFNKVIDPLASIFYVITRMEESTSTFEDRHGRFPLERSVLHRFGWIEKAMCDRWAVDFLRFLDRKELISFRNRSTDVEIIPTFDIDNVFAYQWKNGLRKWVSSAKDLIKGDRRRIIERRDVIRGIKKDPYDTFEDILAVRKAGFAVRMFWLLGDYAKFDRNVSHKDPRHQALIKTMSESCIVGIHPSYKSNSYEYYLHEEKERLEEIILQTVEHSRQHFLKLKISVTYPILIEQGIRHDYTMGFAENVGFRAGTARSFPWFDLTKNKPTELIVHPFAYMDGTLNEYMKLSPLEAKETILKLYKEIQEFGGDFLCVWHNETIGDYGIWEGWREVLNYTLSLNEQK